MNASTPRLLFANSAGQLLADPAGYLHVVWGSKPRTTPDIQALFEQILTQLRQLGWSRVLVDQVVMRPFSIAEQGWIGSDWLPRAVRAGGYRHGAVLVSHDVLTRLATSSVTASVQRYPVFRSFDAEAEARRWLERQPAQPESLPAGF